MHQSGTGVAGANNEGTGSLLPPVEKPVVIDNYAFIRRALSVAGGVISVTAVYTFGVDGVVSLFGRAVSTVGLPVAVNGVSVASLIWILYTVSTPVYLGVNVIVGLAAFYIGSKIAPKFAPVVYYAGYGALKAIRALWALARYIVQLPLSLVYNILSTGLALGQGLWQHRDKVTAAIAVAFMAIIVAHYVASALVQFT